MSRHGIPVLALALALGAAGCVDVAAERGHPPPVVLSVARREVVVALRGDPRLLPAARARLHDAVIGVSGGLTGELGEGPGSAQPLAVRAHIRAATPGDADAVRRALLGLGVDPAHIVIEHAADAPVLLPTVVLTRTIAAVTDCAAAIAPGFHGDVAPSLDSLGRCLQQNNLAGMLVDPADLVDPPALASADAPFLVDGLDSRLVRRESALPSAQFQPGSATSGLAAAGSSYGGAVPAVGNAAPAPAPAAPATP